MRALGEEFRVARERDAGIVDSALVNGSRDDCSKLAAEGAVAGTLEQADDVGAVASLESARDRGYGQRLMFYRECSGYVAARRAVVLPQFNLHSERARALGQH